MEPRSETAGARTYRHDALVQLKQRIHYDAHVWGVGRREKDGSVHILEDQSGSDGVSETFLKGYKDYAGNDIAGVIFSIFPRLTFRASLKHYENCSTSKVDDEDSLHGYLLRSGIDHLLLAGCESNQGHVMWVTLYRKKIPGPYRQPAFTAADEEQARHMVPYFLNEWWRHQLREQTDPQPSTEDAGRAEDDDADVLLELTPQQALIATLQAYDFKANQIVEMLALKSPSQVYEAGRPLARKLQRADPARKTEQAHCRHQLVQLLMFRMLGSLQHLGVSQPLESQVRKPQKA